MFEKYLSLRIGWVFLWFIYIAHLHFLTDSNARLSSLMVYICFARTEVVVDLEHNLKTDGDWS